MPDNTHISLFDLEKEWPGIQLVLEWSDKGGFLFLYGNKGAETELRKRISSIIGTPDVIRAAGNNIEEKTTSMGSQISESFSSTSKNIWLDLKDEQKDVCRRSLAIMNRARTLCEASKKFYTIFLPVDCVRDAVIYAPDALSVRLINCPIADPEPNTPIQPVTSKNKAGMLPP